MVDLEKLTNDLQRLLEASSLVVPSEYRDFLLANDIVELDERFFRAKESGNEYWELVEYFTFDNAQEATNILDAWDPTRIYDLSDKKELLSDFIRIGSTSTGAALLLNCKTGSVHLLAHDFEFENSETTIGQNCSLLFVSSNFYAFQKSLLTEEEAADEDDFGDDWHAMADLRRQKNDQIQEEHRLRKLRKSLDPTNE